MPKSPIKIVSKPGSKDTATYEYVFSHDKRTWVMRIESTKPMNMLDIADALICWGKDLKKEIITPPTKRRQ